MRPMYILQHRGIHEEILPSHPAVVNYRSHLPNVNLAAKSSKEKESAILGVIFMNYNELR